MKKYEKEVLQSQLDDEARELVKLKKLYAKASEDIVTKIKIHDAKIDILLSDFDNLDDTQKSILQSKIYQRDFQKSLKTQIDGFLNDLNKVQYGSVNEYLENCYKSGFTGAMYSIHKQGIPLILPIDQKKVTRALQVDSKISKKLYEKLGDDVNLLKKRIASNLSRGIATASAYDDIARNIARSSNMGFNRAMRIVRTEGARVKNQSAYDGMTGAKKKGADVVKQWCAALDGRTRDTHRQLDGQIRELEEPFEVGGMKAMYPTGFGRAGEDINCRCTTLQRAKWALDEEELETLKERAEYYKLDKTEDFEDFKKKYLKAAEEVVKEPLAKEVKKAQNVGVKLELDNFPEAFKTKAEAKNTQKFIDYINNLEGANPNTLKLYNSMGKLDRLAEQGINFKISHGSNHALRPAYNRLKNQYAEVELVIPKLTGDNLAGEINILLHEKMHLIDFMSMENFNERGAMFSNKHQKLVDAVKNTSENMGGKVEKLFKDFHAELDNIKKQINEEYAEAYRELKEKCTSYTELNKQDKKLLKKLEEKGDYLQRNAMGGGIGGLEDIYDAMSGGKFRDKDIVKYGHGSKYYSNQDLRINEIVANYGALSVTRPDLVEMLREDKPELVEALEDMVEAIGRKIDNE